MTHLPSCKSDVSAQPHPRRPARRGPPASPSLLRHEAMNDTHLRDKLLKLLAVILLGFFHYLGEFLQRAHDSRLLRQRLASLAGNRHEGLDGHGGLSRDP